MSFIANKHDIHVSPPVDIYLPLHHILTGIIAINNPAVHLDKPAGYLPKFIRSERTRVADVRDPRTTRGRASDRDVIFLLHACYTGHSLHGNKGMCVYDTHRSQLTLAQYIVLHTLCQTHRPFALCIKKTHVPLFVPNTVNVVIFAGGKFRENVGKNFQVVVNFTIILLFP